MNEPLAERIRPKTLEDYISQHHLVGENGSLTHQIKKGIIPSLILWGPPGTGKTTLANIIASESKRPFYTLSAISSGVKDVREVIAKAKQSGGLFTAKNPILFIDEIHRFSKSQQDSLLGAVEKGWFTLIGATTENPSFEVIPALLSRCQVYILNPFGKDDLESLLKRAITQDHLLKDKKIKLKETEALLRLSGGDGRKLLNIFELLVNSADKDTITITDDMVMQRVQKNTVLYDKTGEQHYDIISAFIKSIRGSDPNAAVYYLARMVEGGEDVKFIARRLLIPKSNASYMAIKKAQQKVKETGDLSVPIALRNAPTKLMKDLGYGEEYKYAHDYKNNFVEVEFLPKEIQGTSFYKPGENPRENAIRTFLENRWKTKYEL